MRLIDAEPFKGMCIMKPFTVEVNSTPYSTPGTYMVTEYAKVKDVDDIPTADVREVKHGRWEHTDDGAARCTSCKRKMKPYLYGYAYCPLCGARMDGD